MAQFVDFLPLFSESTASIRARLDSDANAGLTPNDPRYVDLREGAFFHDITQVLALEFARLWDALGSEVPASAFPVYAWGEYLDDHGAIFGLARREGTQARGTVTFTGAAGTSVGAGIEVAAATADPLGDPPTFTTDTGGVLDANGLLTVGVTATEIGEEFNVPTGAVVEIVSAAPGVDSVSNASAIIGGTEPESDEDLRERILTAFSGAGAGTENDYKRWALSREGVGQVHVKALWNGAGTVMVVVTDADGQPVPQATIDDVQEYLDPVPGEGKGVAPIGAVVTVTTPAVVSIDVIATLDLDDGYTLDGTGGTIAVRPAVLKALADYIDNLPVGGDVVFNHVQAQFFEVPGVLDVLDLTVEGGTTNVVINDTPPQVPQLGSVGLTA